MISPDLTPRLDALTRAPGAVFIPHVLPGQVQTHRGLYAFFCADFPSLTGPDLKVSRVLRSGPPWPCLPEQLERQGISTAYLRAAPLDFASGRQRALRYGFTHLDGLLGDDPDDSSSRVAWGVPDLVFFDAVVRRVADLRSSRQESSGYFGLPPVFVYSISIGTHPPWSVLDEHRRFLDLPDDLPTGDAIFRIADAAIDRAVRALRSDPLTHDLTIVVTSDEPGPPRGGASLPFSPSSQSVPALFLFPHDFPSVRLPGYRSFVDFPATAAHLTGSSLSRIPGCSWLSACPERPLVSANIYHRRLYAATNSGWIACTFSGLCEFSGDPDPNLSSDLLAFSRIASPLPPPADPILRRTDFRVAPSELLVPHVLVSGYPPETIFDWRFSIAIPPDSPSRGCLEIPRWGNSHRPDDLCLAPGESSVFSGHAFLDARGQDAGFFYARNASPPGVTMEVLFAEVRAIVPSR